MARKSSHVAVGLFVVLGSLLAAGLVIWVGATRHFEKGARYVTYFDESVQGLQKDSPVKYRGVEVGRVERIRVAPDNRLIEVLMKVDLADGVKDDLVAELKSVGITGIVFVDLARLAPGEAAAPPPAAFPAEHPVIPSRASAIRQAFTKAEELVDKLSRVDLEGLTEQFRETGASAERLFEGPGTRMAETVERLSARMDRLVARLDNAYTNDRLARLADAAAADAEALGRLVARAESELAGARVGERSEEAKALIAEARALVAEARAAVAGAKEVVAEAGGTVAEARRDLREMRLPETGRSAARIAEALEEEQRALVPAARESVEELRRVSAELRELVREIRESPSGLLFSEPPPRRK